MKYLKGKKPVLFILLFSGTILLIFLIMQPLEIRYGGDLIGILFPSGRIAMKQRNLLFIIQAIMLLVVIPVYFLTYLFSWVFRADNPKSKYMPDWDDHPIAEFIWWGLPFVLTAIIVAYTWRDTHALDPYKPIEPVEKTKTIQVVALQWKWLFLYPDENIATVNYVQFPEKTPIRFEITADAPMNSLWIPQLAGQIYAMPKMKTLLHLIADKVGDFRGCSANISGDGFAGMHFIASATTEEQYEEWLQSAKQSSKVLNFESYNELARPSSNTPVTIYRLEEDNLFEKIIMKFMHPQEHK